MYMNNRMLQLLCLIFGIAFLSLGTGLIGGRIANQRHQNSASPVPNAAAVPSPNVALPPAPAVLPFQPPESMVPLPVTQQPQAEQAMVPLPPLAPNITAPVEQAPAPSPVVEKKPAAPAAPKPRVKEVRSSTGEVNFVVQILSTPVRDDATAARNRVMDAGFPAGVVEADLGKKGKWYRIYVGPYDTEFEAQAALSTVKNIPGFASSFVKPLD